MSQFETKMEMAEHLRLFLYAYRQLMENEVGVTTKEYFEKSNVLKQEMERIIEILDQHANHKNLGIVSDEAPLITKIRNDLANVLERFENLDREFCGTGLCDKGNTQGHVKG